jgi:hypothetical protein
MSPGIRRVPGADEREEDLRRAEREILNALREIRYGSLEITIHDSRVVQIERREKVRLER